MNEQSTYAFFEEFLYGGFNNAQKSTLRLSILEGAEFSKTKPIETAEVLQQLDPKTEDFQHIDQILQEIKNTAVLPKAELPKDQSSIALPQNSIQNTSALDHMDIALMPAELPKDQSSIALPQSKLDVPEIAIKIHRPGIDMSTTTFHIPAASMPLDLPEIKPLKLLNQTVLSQNINQSQLTIPQQNLSSSDQQPEGNLLLPLTASANQNNGTPSGEPSAEQQAPQNIQIESPYDSVDRQTMKEYEKILNAFDHKSYIPYGLRYAYAQHIGLRRFQ